MDYRILPVTAFAQNCTVLKCRASGRAAVVDPGGDLDRVMAAVAQMGATVEKILVTHGHVDHVAAAAELAAQLAVPIEGPQRGDDQWLAHLLDQKRMFGFPGPCAPFVPDRWLDDGDRVSFGQVTLEVLHTPGHTPGHVCFFHRPTKLALVGDVLFAGSIGRTDFPGGDHAALLRSIRQQLWPLGDDVTFIPGHGPMSTFGEERQSNPFVADGT